MMYTVMPRRPLRPELMMDRMFREFCGHPARPARPGFRVDVRETEGAYLIEAELPGVKLADIDLTLENDVLTIAADRNTMSREEQDGYLHTERRTGHMERSFTLEGIDQAGITAACADGILTVTLPKEAPATGKEKRKIAICGAAPSVPALEASTNA